jgi:transcriptional antiterminator NusG
MAATATKASRWYVLRAATNKERSVAEKLKKESEVGDLMGIVSDVIVPLEYSFFLKNGKKMKREKVKFPSYIFIETSAVGELKYFLKGMNGVSGFLSNRAGEIMPLSDVEVSRMIGDHEKAIEQKENPVNTFIPGEEVKILDGPFSTFVGKVDSIKGDKAKVLVSIFGRQNLIDIGTMQIERV